MSAIQEDTKIDCMNILKEIANHYNGQKYMILNLEMCIKIILNEYFNNFNINL